MSVVRQARDSSGSVQYDLIQVPSYVFPRLIIGVAAFTAGIIFIYEDPGARQLVAKFRF